MVTVGLRGKIRPRRNVVQIRRATTTSRFFLLTIGTTVSICAGGPRRGPMRRNAKQVRRVLVAVGALLEGVTREV